jgi:hypothetical protein
MIPPQLAVAGLQAVGQIGAAAAGGPFMGGDSRSTFGNSPFDSSGWTVNIGSGSASTDNRQTKTDNRNDPVADQFAQSLGYPMAPSMPAPLQAGVNPMMALAVAGLLGFALLRKLGK